MKSAELLCSEFFSTGSTITVKNFEDFVKEFKAWVNTVVKNPYSDDHLIGAIYKENIFFKKKCELVQLCRYHVQIALRCLEEIAQEINGDQKKCEEYKNHIIDYLFDLKFVVEQIMEKATPSYKFVEGWKSDQDSSVWLFRGARNLFWSSTLKTANPVEHRTAINLCVFALRQSLEIRFHRGIGIHKIIGPLFQPPKLRHDFILDFVANNLDLIEIKIGSMTNLSKIYKWTNYSIHSGVFAKIWEIQFAFNYCKELFQPDEHKPGKGWNIYSSIKIKDYAELKKRFEQAVNTVFPDKKWEFIYDQSPEAVIV